MDAHDGLHNPKQDRMAFFFSGLLYNGGGQKEKARMVSHPGGILERRNLT
jgi:hypothetical protein